MKPNELLEKLKETASPKAGRTLDTIYKICVEQQQRGLSDFSIATIARCERADYLPGILPVLITLRDGQ